MNDHEGAKPKKASSNVIEQIKQALPGMAPTNRKIALSILENTQGICFSSIQSLSESIGISEATIVRFAKSLGFSGFASFKKEVQETIKTRLNPYKKIALGELNTLSKHEQIHKLFRYEMDNLKKSYHNLDVKALEAIADGIKKANHVFMSGYGPSQPVVKLFEFLFSANLKTNFTALVGSLSDYNPWLYSFGKQDVLIVVTMPPYSREASHVADIAKSKGGKVFLFTDSPRCPVYAFADQTILCANTTLNFTNSFIGTITTLQTIMNLLLLDNRDAAVKRMKILESQEITGYRKLSHYEE